MSLSTCEHCGGHIPLGPDASNCCEKCGKYIFSSPRSPHLQSRIGEWQARTFGADQTIPGIDCHLIREFKELLDATTPEHQAEEMADILTLLMGRAELMGIDLVAEAEKKFAINLTRTWGKPDAQGVIEHSR